MTMPELSNCPHQPDGWCLECVRTGLFRVGLQAGLLYEIQEKRKSMVEKYSLGTTSRNRNPMAEDFLDLLDIMEKMTDCLRC